MKGFFIALLVLETAMIGVFVSLDLFLFFLFWEVMLIPMYFLIGIWGHERRIYAAVKFVLYTMFGSILMLVAILWLYNVTGTFDLRARFRRSCMRTALVSLPRNTELLLFRAFFLAFAIKVPLFPLHTWLPDAHTEAPTAGSVMLAGVLLKMGTYGMLRFCLPLFPDAAHRAAPRDRGAGDHRHHLRRAGRHGAARFEKARGLLVGEPPGIRGAGNFRVQHDFDAGRDLPDAESRHFHRRALPCASACCTTGATRIEISEFGGLATPMPVLAAFFLFACLSSLALPMLNGFVGEFLILIGMFEHHHAWASWAAIGRVLSAIYLLWAYQRVALGEVTVEKNKTLPDASTRERVILVTMALVILLMGIASPLFTRRMEPATNVLFGSMMNRPRAKRRASAGTAGDFLRPESFRCLPRAALIQNLKHLECVPDADFRRTARQSPQARAGNYSVRVRHPGDGRSIRSLDRARQAGAGLSRTGRDDCCALRQFTSWRSTQGLAYSGLIQRRLRSAFSFTLW